MTMQLSKMMDELGVDPMIRPQLEKEMLRQRAAMSDPDKLKLTPLLEERRQEYMIPDGAFTCQCIYDRVIIWQIPDGNGETYKGSSILMPDTTKDAKL